MKAGDAVQGVRNVRVAGRILAACFNAHVTSSPATFLRRYQFPRPVIDEPGLRWYHLSMAMKLTVRRWTAWIASLVILFAAMAPTLSQAMASQSGASLFAELCTAQGIKFVKLDGSGVADQSNDSAGTMRHCTMCCIHADAALPLPPTSALLLPIVPRLALMPVLYFQAPRNLFSWAPPRSRAPPRIA